MTQPTWAGIDFGFDNTDSDTFRSFVKIAHGATESRQSEFGFPGVDGATMQMLGVGGKTISWRMTVLGTTMADFTALEDALRAKLNDRPYPMVAHGRTRPNVVLMQGPPESIPLMGLGGSDFLYCKVYELTFRDLSP